MNKINKMTQTNLLERFIRKIIKESFEGSYVIFMAGGPGSGKSSVIKALNLSADFEIINPDDEFEKELKAAGLSTSLGDVEDQYHQLRLDIERAKESGDDEILKKIEPKFEELRMILSKNATAFNKARKNASNRRDEISKTGKNIVIDGTGGNFLQIQKQNKILKSLGYKTAMIFIDITLEKSIERISRRAKSGGRKLSNFVIERSLTAVSKNKEKYEEIFADNFILIDTSDDESYQMSIQTAKTKLSKM